MVEQNLYERIGYPLPLYEGDTEDQEYFGDSSSTKRRSQTRRTHANIPRAHQRSRTVLREGMTGMTGMTPTSLPKVNIKAKKRAATRYSPKSEQFLAFQAMRTKSQKSPGRGSKTTDEKSQMDKIIDNCSWYSTCPNWARVKRYLDSKVYEIPLQYYDYTISFKNFVGFSCVYERPQISNYKQLIQTYLNPSLSVYEQSELRCLWKNHADANVNQKKNKEQYIFDSVFEGGNLDKVYKVRENEYNWLMSSDANTRGNTQWFYFAISNKSKDRTIKINIVNFTKDGSIFIRGMKPNTYSKKRYRKYRTGWVRSGDDITYSKNSYVRKTRRYMSHYYTLTFSYTFQYDNDTVFFAYSEPYLYTQLQKYLNNLLPDQSVLMNISDLCSTIGGIVCPMLTISGKGIKKDSLDTIVVTARVHPGETVGSFMAEGLINFLISGDRAAMSLRQRWIIKVIPMLNPDGVIVGNYRVGLAGVDLNRKWDRPDQSLYPTIHAAKMRVPSAVAFIDLHGHSKKDGYFMYGNRVSRDETYWKAKFLPIMFSKLSDNFSLINSRYLSNTGPTARAVCNHLGLRHSFTLEASFGGSIVKGEHVEFKASTHRKTGKILGETLYYLHSHVIKPNQSNTLPDNLTFEALIFITNQIKDKHEKQKRRQKHAKKPPKLTRVIKPEPKPDTVKSNSESSGSDSEPSEDELEHEDLRQIQAQIKVISYANAYEPTPARQAIIRSSLDAVVNRPDQTLQAYMEEHKKKRRSIIKYTNRSLVHKTYTGLAVLNQRRHLPPL